MDASRQTDPPRIARLLRRASALLAAAALALAIAAVPASAESQTVQSADSFVDSIGVNTHLYYDDTVYHQRFDGIEQKLKELGVRHIREVLAPERSDQYDRLNELAAAGVKTDLVLGDPDIGEAGLQELISTLDEHLRNAADAVEGPNEFDSRGGPDWASSLRSYQQRLFDSIKSSSLSWLPVIGPSIVQRRNEEAVGDISGMLDYGNVHSYPNGFEPESNLTGYLARGALNAGSKPVMATETGYHNALGWSGEHNPTSEQAAAVYMPRLFLEYFSRGVARTYAYELANPWSDPGDRDSNFGLLRNDLSEKPAFGALRNTIQILADPGPAFSPDSLDYSVEDSGSDLHQVLLQKRDGSFYLALWRAESVWDPTARASVAASSSPVTLRFGRRVESAERYQPTESSSPNGIAPRQDGSLSVNVGAQVTILHLGLGGAAPAGTGRISFWISRSSVPAGGRVAVGGRLPRQATGRRQPVNIQRWQSDRKSWRTIGHGRTSRRGTFRKAFRLSPHRFGRVSRLRVVARRTKPSRALRVRIRRSSGPTVAIGAAKAVAPGPSPSVTP